MDSPTTTQTPDPISQTPLVTIDEHEQGWKEVEVEFRSGRKTVWRLKAPPARAARTAFFEALHGQDAYAIVRMALPEHAPETDLDRLTPESLDRVGNVVNTLAFGEKEQKKMTAAARLLAELMLKASSVASSAPNSGWPAADSTPPKSGAGASPSSSSIATNSTPN